MNPIQPWFACNSPSSFPPSPLPQPPSLTQLSISPQVFYPTLMLFMTNGQLTNPFIGGSSIFPLCIFPQKYEVPKKKNPLCWHVNFFTALPHSCLPIPPLLLFLTKVTKIELLIRRTGLSLFSSTDFRPLFIPFISLFRGWMPSLLRPFLASSSSSFGSNGIGSGKSSIYNKYSANLPHSKARVWPDYDEEGGYPATPPFIVPYLSLMFFC